MSCDVGRNNILCRVGNESYLIFKASVQSYGYTDGVFLHVCHSVKQHIIIGH